MFRCLLFDRVVFIKQIYQAHFVNISVLLDDKILKMFEKKIVNIKFDFFINKMMTSVLNYLRKDRLIKSKIGLCVLLELHKALKKHC